MRDVVEYTIFDAKASAGVGKVIPCQDFRHAVLAFATSGNANLTIKFAGAVCDGATDGQPPDFGAAQSPTNIWDYIEVTDLQDGTPIDGDTGISLSGTDDVRLLQMNIDGLKYLTGIITARSAGAVTLKVILFNE